MLNQTQISLLLLLLVTGVSQAQNQDTADFVTLTSVHVDKKADALRVAITGPGPFAYSVSDSETPAQIVVHIPAARFADLPMRYPVKRGGVRSVQLHQEKGDEQTARLTIPLARQTTYRVIKDRNRLRLHIAYPEGATAATPTPLAPVRSAVPSPRQEAYRVGPKDVLDIAVYREADLSRTFRVRGDGFFSFPLIGRVRAQGCTTAELETALERRLAQGYLVKPQVSVAVATYQSQPVFVLGAVRNPGHFYLHGNTTLLEMISRAGGLRHTDGPSNVLVLLRDGAAHGTNGTTPDQDVQAIRVDLEKLLEQGEMRLNMPVRAQDVIYVPQPASLFVFGEVKNPGPILLSSKNMTLLEALSKAGGLTDMAAPNRTRVVRVVDGVERRIRVNVAHIMKRGDRSKDIVLKPDDIVVVPKSLF